MDSHFITYATDVLGDTQSGLSGSEIAKYSTEFAVKYNVAIPYGTYPFPKTLSNKRTALRRNIEEFSGEQQFQIILWLCELPQLEQQEPIKNLKLRLLTNYGKQYGMINIPDSSVVDETYHWLIDYPRALEKYNESLIKYHANLFVRSSIDDMRLSFELVVKEILCNEKSLENQIQEIGSRLKEKDVSAELRNMYVKLVDYYTKYQNTYVKHDDRVNKNEIEYIIELTSLMMKFLIKTLG
ncbi:hypothetical protein [Schinkia azotoformans]|uniref:hypothetical protein n=1 Tax=Schinkia azotoformans TaxID=1454 RepID=UPI002DBA0C5F|nr:hypothetical protein [Schinkia azotoformans]MEC1742262.1 hypothetical protein [Schinkia azotoformans]MEC1767509.1 hypothetical protein [Schinkia azotoformans]MEC1788601.1 hypothetical protein [Schinkia azotoformans]MED4419832.1 hypothetical protein [Schinkia azotoformans]